MGTLANSKDLEMLYYVEMLYYAAKGSISSRSALFAKTKSIFRERNTIFFEIITCDPLNIYNRPLRL